MGKIRRFLGIFVSLFVFAFVTHAHANDYVCNTAKAIYNSCNAGYYLSDCGNIRDGSEFTGTPAVANSCLPCPSGTTCAGGTACPKTACIKVTFDNATNAHGNLTVGAAQVVAYKKIGGKDLYADSGCENPFSLVLPQKNNATFSGYYKTQNSTATKDRCTSATGAWLTATCNPSSDLTVYAHYSCAEGYSENASGVCLGQCYTIRFDNSANGGASGGTDRVYKKLGDTTLYSDDACSKIATIKSPVKPNATFKGYYESATGNTECISATGQWNTACPQTGDKTLYPHYDCDSGWRVSGVDIAGACTTDCFQITLNNTLRGGTGGSTVAYKKEGSATLYGDRTCTTALAFVQPTKEHATFAGYLVSPDNTQTCTTGSDNLQWEDSSDCKVSADTTMYAKYTCDDDYSGAGIDIAGQCVETPVACIYITLDAGANGGTITDANGTQQTILTVYKKAEEGTALYSDENCSTEYKPATAKVKKDNATYRGFFATTSGGKSCIGTGGTWNTTNCGTPLSDGITLYAQYNCKSGYTGAGASISGICIKDCYRINLTSTPGANDTAWVYKKFGDNTKFYSNSGCSTQTTLTSPTAPTGALYNGYYTADGTPVITSSNAWESGWEPTDDVTGLYAKYSCTTGYVSNSSGECAPGCFKVNLDSTTNGGDGGTNVVYKHYSGDELYSDADCTMVLTNGVTAPTKAHGNFTGYYSPYGYLCISASGEWAPSYHSCNPYEEMTMYAKYNCVAPYDALGTTTSDACTDRVPGCIEITLDDGTGTPRNVYKWTGLDELYNDKKCEIPLSLVTPDKDNATFTGYFDSISGGAQCITKYGTWNSACQLDDDTELHARYACNPGYAENASGACVQNCFLVTLDPDPDSVLVSGGTPVYKKTGSTTIYSANCERPYSEKPTRDNATYAGHYDARGKTQYITPDWAWVANWEPTDNTTVLYGQYTCHTGYEMGMGACVQKCIKVNLNNTQNGGTGGISAIYRHYGSDILYSDAICTDVLRNGVAAPTKANATFVGYYTDGDDECIDNNGAWQQTRACDAVAESTLYAQYQCRAGFSDISNVCTGTISATASDRTKQYDGTALTCDGLRITAPASGYTVAYCTTPIGSDKAICMPSTSNPVPTVTNVSDSVNVHYQITADAYTTKTGTFKCSVTPAYCAMAVIDKNNDSINDVTLDVASGSQTFDINLIDNGMSVEANLSLTLTGGDSTALDASVTGKKLTLVPKKATSPAPVEFRIDTDGNANYHQASMYLTIWVKCGDGNYTAADNTCHACPANADKCGEDGFTCRNGYQKNAAGDACESKEYTVTYNCGDGAGAAPAVAKPKYDQSFTPATNTCTAPAGHEFAGWSVSNTDDIKQTGMAFTWTYTENKTFTAQWNTIGNYSATYDCGAGTGTPPTTDRDIAYETTYTFKANTCTAPTGYYFAGWNDGGNVFAAGQEITWRYLASKTFTANWEPRCLAITVDSQNATTNAEPTTVYLKYWNGWYSDAECKTPITAFTTQAARNGYTLDGFYTNTTNYGIRVVDNAGTFLVTGQTKISYADNGTMYAKWTPATYDISYTLNGGIQATTGIPTNYTYGVGASVTGQPTRSGYLFAGWCTDTGLNTCATNQTIDTTEFGDKAFYAKWSNCPANATCENNTITCNENYTLDNDTCKLSVLACEPGKYYPGTGEMLQPCPNGYFCPGDGVATVGNGTAQCRESCPANATCTNGVITCNENHTLDNSTNTCKLGVLTCEPGKYYPGTGEVLQPCPNGYFCPGDGVAEIDNDVIQCRKKCPDNATCTNGMITCNENYTLDNDTCKLSVLACEPGKYYPGTGEMLQPCPNGYFCPGDGVATVGNGTAQCRESCPANATCTNGVIMCNENYKFTADGNACEIAGCDTGYILSDGKCQACPTGFYCPTDNPDDMAQCPADWATSDGQATKKQDCYRKCESYKVKGGTAIPTKPTAFWPNECAFTGISDNGNKCEIVDDVCIETACGNTHELKNGVCVPCDRDHAMSYLPNGNCMVASCEIGYHPHGQSCEPNTKTCNAANAVRASQNWDSKSNSFGTCVIEQCEDGYHIASNSCVADEQTCVVDHGVGTREWNAATKSWGQCVATLCDAGYTNDPYETNEPSKQCGQCKNRFSALGEIAVSTYARGCEIAACMYQGEIYNLENNECVPICDTVTDETGSRKRDGNKCVRKCEPGYVMW